MAVGQPMGQQVYERELAQRAPAELGPGWEVAEVVVRSLRSPLPGTVRLPSTLLMEPRPRCDGPPGVWSTAGAGSSTGWTSDSHRHRHPRC
jgi:hypothetical protein